MNQAIERLLTAAGFQAVPFTSAEALLEAGIVHLAACLVLDIHLPGISGFDLNRQLVQSGSHAPVIFITAYDDPESQAEAREAGAIAYVVKPFAGKTLLTAITRALEPKMI